MTTEARPKSRTVKRIAIGVAVVIVIVVGGYSAKGFWRVYEMNKDVLPEFTDPPEGARAPVAKGFGVTIGTTTLDDTERLLAEWGLTCKDTSMRALMGAQREKKKAEIEAAKERGESVDGISGASLVDYKSPKEKNPQVRLSCTDTPSTKLKDRERQESAGRALFIHDSPKHAIRHASFRRQHANHPHARDDIADSVNHYIRIYGDPHEMKPLPPIEEDGSVRFPDTVPYKFVWSYADLTVRVEAMSHGKRGVDVNEVIEVPWPVRATAPADPR